MKLKIIALNVMLCLLIMPVYSQVAWFPEGAVWHYRFLSWGGEGFTKLEVLSDDTIIGLNLYKKLLSTTVYTNFGSLDTFHEFLYVYENNQMVSGKDQYSPGGIFLYDLSAAVGDTLPMYFGGLSPGPFIVDSIGIIIQNGFSLKFQRISFPSLFSEGEYDKKNVVEGIGSIGSHLFHDHTILQPFDAPFYAFLCYEDPILGRIDFFEGEVDCDFISETTDTHDYLISEISLYPNPVTDMATIQTESSTADNIIVIDILGQVLYSKKTDRQTLISLDLNFLEPGLYYIFGKDKGEKILFTQKFIKK